MGARRLSDGPFARFPAVVISAEDETARVTLLVFGELRDVTVPTAHLALPIEA